MNWTCLQVELKFFHEGEVRGVDFFNVFCGTLIPFPFPFEPLPRRLELDMFSLRKIASSHVILARTICVPVACVVACVSSRAVKVQKQKQKTHPFHSNKPRSLVVDVPKHFFRSLSLTHTRCWRIFHCVWNISAFAGSLNNQDCIFHFLCFTVDSSLTKRERACS